MLEEKGSRAFRDADELNVPVSILLIENEDDETGVMDDRWRLIAANYMPLKGFVKEDLFDTVADNREELVEIIREHVIPLYQTALKKLQAICEGKTDCLLEWKMD